MDGLLGFQTSQNDWSASIRPTVNERIQGVSQLWRPEVENSVLEDIEAQMAHYEFEYAAHLDELGKLYVIPTDGLVAEFLNDHRALPPILISAEPHLRRYFPETILALRATSDEYGWDNLYVNVWWPGDPRDAFRLLDQFGDDWWIAHSRPARGALTFTYRLV